MQDDRVGSPADGTPDQQTLVSPNNPCPFLRALVAGGFVGGHIARYWPIRRRSAKFRKAAVIPSRQAFL
jgi:hypothetical protein